MPHENHEWSARIKAVEREYAVMRLAIDHLRIIALPNPAILRGAFKIGEIDEASSLLECTYIIRLYAEFEAGLRSFRQANRDTEPQMSQLLDLVASGQGIPDDELVNAHKARNYRNDLVHHRRKGTNPIVLATFRKYLCMYFRHLPPFWGD